MPPMPRKWYTYKVSFADLEKILNSCSQKGHTIFQVFQCPKPNGYYDVIAYKEPPNVPS